MWPLPSAVEPPGGPDNRLLKASAASPGEARPIQSRVITWAMDGSSQLAS